MSSLAERLAYWYFRLNGFLLWENFLSQGETGDLLGEVDLIGLRFPDRRETLLNTLEDDVHFSSLARQCVILVEVTSGPCKFNDPMRDRHKVSHLLRAVGCFSFDECSDASKRLVASGYYENNKLCCRLVAVGTEMGEIPTGALPLTFDDMIRMMHRRLRQNLDQKPNVEKWDWAGKQLRSLAEQHESLTQYMQAVRTCFGLSNRAPSAR